MNTPNKITVFRLILVPFLVTSLLCGKYIGALILFLIASYTDYLDGKIARKYGKITAFGKFADPLADKALIMSVFICFVELNKVSAVAVILMLIRELVVMSVRLSAAKEGTVVAADFFGKAKTVSQIIAAVLVMISLAIKPYNNYFMLIEQIFVWISVVLSWLSGVKYVYENYKFIKETN